LVDADAMASYQLPLGPDNPVRRAADRRSGGTSHRARCRRTGGHRL